MRPPRVARVAGVARPRTRARRERRQAPASSSVRPAAGAPGRDAGLARDVAVERRIERRAITRPFAVRRCCTRPASMSADEARDLRQARLSIVSGPRRVVSPLTMVELLCGDAPPEQAPAGRRGDVSAAAFETQARGIERRRDAALVVVPGLIESLREHDRVDGETARSRCGSDTPRSRCRAS